MVVPVIGNKAFTVRVTLVVQPSVVVYCITDVPAEIPVTTPVVGSIVALDVLLLVHVPPVTELLNVVVLPTQTAGVPVIGNDG